LIRFLLKLEQWANYFKKDAFINIDYMYASEEGDLVKKKDAFSITICHQGKCKSHFGKIPWEEADKVLSVLKESKGKVLLSVQVGMGESEILIPKWAKRTLMEELEKEG